MSSNVNMRRVTKTRANSQETRCTGERGGCQRCLSRSNPCRYPGNSKNHKATNDWNQTLNGSPRTPDEDIAPSFPGSEQMDMALSGGSIDTDTAPSRSDCTLPATFQSDDSSPFMDLVGQSPSFASIEDFNTLHLEGGIGMLDIDTESLFTTPPESRTGTGHVANSEAVCQCHTQAITMYELVEVNLVWAGKQQLIGAVEMLQHQKRIIAGCEPLLDCQQCTGQSNFSLLLISIYDKLTSSLEDALQGAKLIQIGSSDPSPPLKGHGRRKSGPGRDDRGKERQLDDEDHQAAVASLFVIRVSKLLALLSRTEQLVIESDWLPHKDMAQLLRHRLRLVQERIFSREGEEQ